MNGGGFFFYFVFKGVGNIILEMGFVYRSLGVMDLFLFVIRGNLLSRV